MNLPAKNTRHTVIHPIRPLQLTTLSVKNPSKSISNFSHKARGLLKIIIGTYLNVWIPIQIYHVTSFIVTSLFGVPGFIEQDGGPLFSTSINLRAFCHSSEYFTRERRHVAVAQFDFHKVYACINLVSLGQRGQLPLARNFDNGLKIVIGNYSRSIHLHWPTISQR